MKFKTMDKVDISPDDYDFDWGDMSLEGEDFVLPEAQEKHQAQLSAKELELLSKDEQITALKKQVHTMEQSIEILETENKGLRKRLITVVKMVMPLLNNLSKEPDKPTIYWPERALKVQQFKDKLLGVSGVEV